MKMRRIQLFNSIILSSFFFLLFLVLFLFFSDEFGFQHKLSFGLGLGDLVMSIFLSICTSILLIMYFLESHINRKMKVTVLLITAAIIVYTILALSVWRGIEQPWDGSFFIPRN